MHLFWGGWDVPTNEPFADVLDPDEDTDGAPVHGEIVHGIQIVSGECLVCGEGGEEEREPGTERGVSICQLQGVGEGWICAYLTRWNTREVIMILSLFLAGWISSKVLWSAISLWAGRE